MAVVREVPYPSANFTVDLGTGTTGAAAGVSEVVFPDARVRIVEYRPGNAPNTAPQRIATTTDYTNLILRRGASGALDWYDWWNQVRSGDQGAIRTVVVHLLDEARTGPVLTWRFLRARAVAHLFSPLVSAGSTVLMETLELAFERMELE